MACVALADQLEDDLKAAMKARRSQEVAALRSALAAVKNARVAEGRQGELTDDEVTELIAKEAKRRRESLESYSGAGREDLAETERAELRVLEHYLPAGLDDDELAALIDAVITETGASGPEDLGPVMAAVMPKTQGRADGKRVNALARQRLEAAAG